MVKDTAFAMDTWNTARFLGLESASGTGGVWAANGGVANAEKGVVVDILDSGSSSVGYQPCAMSTNLE